MSDPIGEEVVISEPIPISDPVVPISELDPESTFVGDSALTESEAEGAVSSADSLLQADDESTSTPKMRKSEKRKYLRLHIIINPQSVFCGQIIKRRVCNRNSLSMPPASAAGTSSLENLPSP